VLAQTTRILCNEEPLPSEREAESEPERNFHFESEKRDP
jgi:hypothetical protein